MRDIDSGISYFYNIDTCERISDNILGSGLINTKVVSNKTEDSSSHVMKKQKSIKYKKTKNNITNTENKGNMIVKLLQTHPDNIKFNSKISKKKTKEQLNNDILRLNFENLIDM